MAFKWILAPLLATVMTVVMTAVPVSALPGPTHAGTDVAGTVPQVLKAVSEKNARSYECSMGDAEADAVRLSLGTDFAIVCGGDLVQNLLPGEITYDSLKAAFKEDRPLAVVNITPKVLKTVLEAGFSHITLDNAEKIDGTASAYDGFPQISGFTVRYDASAPPGSRVYQVDINGKRLNLEDNQTVFRLAATVYMLGGGYDLPAVDGGTAAGLTLSGAMAAYLNQSMPDYSQTGTRIYPIGGQDANLAAYVPMGIALVVIAIILVGNGQRFKHMFNHEL